MRALVVLALVSAQALAPRRRTFLVAAAGGAASARASTDGVVREISLGEAVKAIITDGNPDWVRAVVQAGFVYRGVAEASPTLRRDATPYSRHAYPAKAAGYFRSSTPQTARADRVRERRTSPSPTREPRPGGAPLHRSGPRRDGRRCGPAFWPANANAGVNAKSLRVDEGPHASEKARSSTRATHPSPCPTLEASLRAGLGLF